MRQYWLACLVWGLTQTIYEQTPLGAALAIEVSRTAMSIRIRRSLSGFEADRLPGLWRQACFVL
jgi:hypothetical protein